MPFTFHLFYFHLPPTLFLPPICFVLWMQDRDLLCPLHPAQKAAPVPWCPEVPLPSSLSPESSLVYCPGRGKAKFGRSTARRDFILFVALLRRMMGAGASVSCAGSQLSPGRQRGDAGQARGAEPPSGCGSTRESLEGGTDTAPSYFPPPAEKFSQRLRRP